MAPHPETPVQLQRLIKALTPHVAQALRGVRSAYAGYADADVIATCRESANELASEMASVLSIPVSGRQLCLICVDAEPWAERQAWERLLAHIAVLSAVGPPPTLPSFSSGSQSEDLQESLPEDMSLDLPGDFGKP